jgi:hypothetical protein
LVEDAAVVDEVAVDDAAVALMASCIGVRGRHAGSTATDNEGAGGWDVGLPRADGSAYLPAR